MTVEELANKRYGGEFVFMFGHLEGRTRFVFECFDPRPDHEGKNTYIVSYFDKGLRRRDVVDVPYNWALDLKIKTYQGEKRSMSAVDLCKQLTLLKKR